MKFTLNNNVKRNLVVCEESVSIEEALMLMKSHSIRHLPVVDSGKKVVGFVSDRDLYKALSGEETMVSQIMRREFVKFDLKTSMREVVDSMIKMKFSAFLVTDESKVMGIITSEDMLVLLSQLLADKGEEKSLLSDFLYSVKELQWLVTSPNVVT